MQTCGFVRGNVLCELGQHSLLVLECMVYYTKRFPCVAVRPNFVIHGIPSAHTIKPICREV